MISLKTLNKCISTKNRPNAENRGYGIRTSKNILVSGLRGQYLMISGNTLYVYDKVHGDNYISNSCNLKWGGTLIAYRIPIEKDGFEYYRYTI